MCVKNKEKMYNVWFLSNKNRFRIMKKVNFGYDIFIFRESEIIK